MEIKAVLNAQKITELAKERFKEERSLNHLEGCFWQKRSSGNVTKNSKMIRTVSGSQRHRLR